MAYRDIAIKYHEQGYNCCQAVVCAFKDQFDLDEKTLFKLTEAYGLGMGNMQGTCGALSGALMVMSYLNSTGKIGEEMPKSKGQTYQLDRLIAGKFIEQNGSMICKDLKTPGPNQVPCNMCIARACDILEAELSNIKGTMFE